MERDPSTPTRRRARWRHALIAAIAIAIGTTGAVAPAGSPARAAESGYRSLPAPQRLLDTRAGASTADGRFAGAGLRGAGTTLELAVAGRVGIPSGPAAVALNVTVTEPAAAGFVTVYPCGDRPTASNLNHVAGQTVPNAVITALSARGTVCIFTLQATHLVVDASGWFPTGAFTPLAQPQRVLDTRPGQPTADGRFSGVGTVAAGATLTVPIAGRVGIPANASAVALNVTVTEGRGPGFVTVFPCGATPPTASNVNYTAGQTVPNLVVSRLGTGGAICLFTPTAAELVVDVSGVLPAATFRPLAEPQRLLDTRPGQPTADGAFRESGTQPGGATLQLRVAGRVGIPADASAVMLNVTAVPASFGFVTAHPRGTSLPNASNVNHRPGGVVANAVVARVGTAGDICVFTSGATDLVIDVAGWLTGPPPTTGGVACPSLTPGGGAARAELLARPGLHAAIGTDRIAVLACDVPADSSGSRTLDPVDVANWANDEVTAWFVEASNGRYRPVFEAHPQRRITRNSMGDCVLAGRDITPAPFTNVMVYDSTTYGGGQAGPGFIGTADVRVLDRPPSQSRRGLWVGGGVPLIDPSVVIHELGHTLHWPHSYIGPGEYDNPVDMMSGSPITQVDDLSDFCPSLRAGLFQWCRAQNTLAFNRLAAGWVDDAQVAIHRSGDVTYLLDRPHGAGTQLVALPDRDAAWSSMVVEARPTTGNDRFNERAGVAVHLVDQGNGGFSGISVNRRQRQATGTPNSYAHVIPPGASATLHGVTITVLGAAGEGYSVRISGSYRRPAELLATSLDQAQVVGTPLR
jgi:hypothetical protein